MIADVLQQLLERGIADSERARARLQALEGEVLRIEVEGLGLGFNLGARSGGIFVDSSPGTEASAELKAAPLDLLRLAGPGALGRLSSTRAELTGKLHVAEGFAEVIRLADLDLEGELAKWTGDIVAHRLGASVRSLGAWCSRAARSFETSMAGYLQEEDRSLPKAYEAQEFYEHVDRLRDAVDRVEQRLDLLERRSRRGRLS